MGVGDIGGVSYQIRFSASQQNLACCILNLRDGHWGFGEGWGWGTKFVFSAHFSKFGM